MYANVMFMYLWYEIAIQKIPNFYNLLSGVRSWAWHNYIRASIDSGISLHMHNVDIDYSKWVD